MSEKTTSANNAFENTTSANHASENNASDEKPIFVTKPKKAKKSPSAEVAMLFREHLLGIKTFLEWMITYAIIKIAMDNASWLVSASQITKSELIIKIVALCAIMSIRDVFQRYWVSLLHIYEPPYPDTLPFPVPIVDKDKGYGVTFISYAPKISVLCPFRSLMTFVVATITGISHCSNDTYSQIALHITACADIILLAIFTHMLYILCCHPQSRVNSEVEATIEVDQDIEQ